MATDEREITSAVSLTTAGGRLNDAACGWARRPLFDARELGAWGRRKRWDYWCVISPAGALQLTIAHLDYAGLVEVAFVDLRTHRVASTARIVPFGLGIRLPAGVEGGPIEIGMPGLSVAVEPIGGTTLIDLSATTLSGPISAALTVEPGGDSLDVVVPWSEREYQLTSKHVARPAHGSVTAMGTTHRLERGETFGCLDYGRGRWPWETTWNWGTAAADVPGVGRVGVQLGGKWTDGTGATENGVFVEGHLDKIGAELRWTYDLADARAPWTVDDERGDVALTFVPEVVRRAGVDLGVVRSQLHLAFGRWKGTVRAHGETIPIDGALGWAEEHRARW